MPGKQQVQLIVGIAVPLLLLGGIAAIIVSRPSAAPEPAAGAAASPAPEDGDPVEAIVQAFVGEESGALALDPANKASSDALAAGAVPEKAVPSFGPKAISIRGATRITILGSPASVAAYQGELGRFAVISVKGKASDFAGVSLVPFGSHRFLSGSRSGGGSDVHLVGVHQGSRMTFLVGRQPSAKLAELATMFPP